MTDTWSADETSAACAVAGPATPAATSVARPTVMALRAYMGRPPQVTPYSGATRVGPR